VISVRDATDRKSVSAFTVTFRVSSRGGGKRFVLQKRIGVGEQASYAEYNDVLNYSHKWPLRGVRK
jgi:hypothetical protein